jgi:hypothetical protein
MPRTRRKRTTPPKLGECFDIGGKNKDVHLCFRGRDARFKSGKKSPTGWVIEKKVIEKK